MMGKPKAKRASRLRPEDVHVTIDIGPGPVMPAQRESWRRFWGKLLAQADGAPGNEALPKGDKQ